MENMYINMYILNNIFFPFYYEQITMIIKVFTIQENICQYLPYNNELIKNQFKI